MSLGLGDLSNSRDVWNLMVDTANPNNFEVRSSVVPILSNQTLTTKLSKRN